MCIIRYAHLFTVLLRGPLFPEKVVQGLTRAHLHPRAGEDLDKVVKGEIVPIF